MILNFLPVWLKRARKSDMFYEIEIWTERGFVSTNYSSPFSQIHFNPQVPHRSILETIVSRVTVTSFHPTKSVTSTQTRDFNTNSSLQHKSVACRIRVEATDLFGLKKGWLLCEIDVLN